MSQGQVNVYVCETCGGKTITKDRDDGATPFLLGCAVNGCDGMGESSFYRVDQSLTPSRLWIKPTDDELKDYMTKNPEFEDMIREHVRQGGLIDVPAPVPERVH